MPELKSGGGMGCGGEVVGSGVTGTVVCLAIAVGVAETVLVATGFCDSTVSIKELAALLDH